MIKGYRYNNLTGKLERDLSLDEPDIDTSKMLGKNSTKTQVIENLNILNRNGEVISGIHKNISENKKTREHLVKEKEKLEKSISYFGIALARSESEDAIAINKHCLREAAETLRDIARQLKSMK